MANTITGRIRKITPTKAIVSEKTGNTYYKREVILDATRYDPYTGDKLFDNFPMLEFGGEEACRSLDAYKEGDIVTISFDLNGREYADKNTGEVKYFTTVRGYRIENKSRNNQAYAPAQASPSGNGIHGTTQAAGQARDVFPPRVDDNGLPF